MSSSLEGVYEPGIVDPGVPVTNSTTPFWLSSPHPLADHQSPWPSEPMDIVIIGSGISGTSLARTLVSKRPELRVVLIDARSLCSGATARNGGHIKTMTFAVWEDRKKTYGVEEAVRISAFEHSHLEAMASLVRENELDCDFLRVEGVDAYYDKPSFEKAIAALNDMKKHAPHLASKYKIYRDKDRIRRVMKLSSRCVGAIGVPAASLWPYKLVTGILGPLIEEERLNVQTHTTVQAVEDAAKAEFALVRTDRGDIKARTVIHATNGWLGHLLPELRPFISPVRGNVVHYGPGDKIRGFSAMGLDSKFSFWLRYAAKDYDYLIQRAHGDVVVGRANTGRKTTGDDSETDMSPMAHLRGFADEAVASPTPGAASLVSHAWSGILGFTQDAMPFAGKLPFPAHSHQWVCGGYHGIGMVKAFRTAEMVALMVLGEELSDEYPKSMLITEERLKTLRRSLGPVEEVVRSKLYSDEAWEPRCNHWFFDCGARLIAVNKARRLDNVTESGRMTIGKSTRRVRSRPSGWDSAKSNTVTMSSNDVHGLGTYAGEDAHKLETGPSKYLSPFLGLLDTYGLGSTVSTMMFNVLLLSAIVGLARGLASTDTITWGGDNTRTGYFTTHNMDPAVVGSSQFGQLFKTVLPGSYIGAKEQIFSQPLVYTPSGSDTQYVYFATTQNNVYKLDAKTGVILKSRNLGIPFLAADLDGCVDINPCIGVTGTGVIDPSTGTLYLTSKTYIDQNAGTAPQGRPAGRYYVHALDVNDLSERPNFPVNLENQVARNNPDRWFTGGIHHQRPGLLLTGQYVYFGFASHCVQYNFTGWIMGLDKTTGNIVEKWAAEGPGVPTNIQGAGIWASGGGLASDDKGSMFFATGNGYASQLSTIPVSGFNPPTAMEEAACHMTINPDGTLTLIDFFMPYEKQELDGADKDLGTSPLELLPSQFSCGDSRRIGVITGKSGKTYWLNLDNLGGYRNGPNNKDNVIQTYQNENSVYAGAGVYPLEGGYIYINVIQYPSHVFKFSCTNGIASFTKVADTPVNNAYILGVSHGTTTSLNNQEGTGLLWITDVQNTNFRIYNAVPKGGNMTLVNSFTIPGITKFTRPVFGDGAVYFGTTQGLVYGYGSTSKSPLNCSSPISFGSLDITATSAATTINCTALADIKVSAIGLADKTNYAISGLPTVPLTLAKGGTFTLKAVFAPRSVGRVNADIIVNTTSSTFSNSTLIRLTGVGNSAGALLSVSPKSVTFANVVVGQDPSGETVLLGNDGSSALAITSIQYSTTDANGPFQTWTGNGSLQAGKFTISNIPSNIAGGQSAAVIVKFDSSLAGTYTGYIKFISDGGTGTLSLSATAGAAPVALIEFQTPDGTGWVQYSADTPFTFGDVTENTARGLKFRLTNNAPPGAAKLSLTVSKPPFGVAGIIRAANQVDLAEGTILGAGQSAYAVLTCSVPKSQWNVDTYNGTAQWTMNTNDPVFDKQFVQFFCNAVAEQSPPLLPSGQSKYRYIGCYRENNPGRQLSNLLYGDDKSTTPQCIQACAGKNNIFCGTQYHRECWGGNTIPNLKVDDSNCNFACAGDLNQICGGQGVGAGAGYPYFSLFADSLQYANGKFTGNGGAVTAPTGPFVNPGVSGYGSIGCYTEATSGRALSNGKSNSLANVAGCLAACSAGSYTYAGVEYGGECYCGNAFAAGSVPTTIDQCAMTCNGNTTEYCGGPSRLNMYKLGGAGTVVYNFVRLSFHVFFDDYDFSFQLNVEYYDDNRIYDCNQHAYDQHNYFNYYNQVYHKYHVHSKHHVNFEYDNFKHYIHIDAVATPTGPIIQMKISNWDFQGCWTEANGMRALSQKGYAKDDMTLESCSSFCDGYTYFGTEHLESLFFDGVDFVFDNITVFHDYFYFINYFFTDVFYDDFVLFFSSIDYD
ncbi:hypothetical protein G7046_g2604 [Stylonectria norvegica]|nr:hypothetical protein G7046_g2604 [Stylonectria norvegica]